MPLPKKTLATRASISEATQNAVLTKSRRRCCFCFWLQGVDEVQKGQIAHLDQDRQNNSEDNLVFFCLEHHDEYDGKTSQSKGLRESEARHWRDELYREMRYRSRSDITDERKSEIFEDSEALMGDLLDALRRDIAEQPLGRLIVLSDPIARWGGPRILFVYRENAFPNLKDKAHILHSRRLLRHDEASFYYISEEFAEYLLGKRPIAIKSSKKIRS